MKFRSGLLALLACVFVLSGCANSLTDFSLTDEEESASTFQHGEFVERAQPISSNSLEHHTKSIVAEMTASMNTNRLKGIVAITNFVYANSDYNATDGLGFALGESFLRSLHQSGFKTLDYKVADVIRVTHAGDFALSRDFMELKNEVPADYVLVGTLVEQHHGVVVNARLVELSSKAILATGKSFIPRRTVNLLVSNSPVSSN